MALTERLALIISANGAQAVHEMDRLGAKLTGVDGLARKTATSGGVVGKAFTGAALLGAAALVEMVKKGSEALVEQQRIDAQTKAALASTGAAAGVSASQVGLLGEELSHYSAYSIEAVKQTENLLLTFTAVKNQAGEGNDVFTQTTKAVLDMSTALGEDLKDASIQVGKALNNPIVGLTALRRVGVTFDEQQVATIKHLTQTGHLLEAQKLILAELNKEFGNSAEAAGKTAAGGFAQLRNSVVELDKIVAGPVLEPLTSGLHNMAAIVQEINKHPLAAKVFSEVAGVAATAYLASKALGVLARVKESEIARTVAGTAARERGVVALGAEAAAADRAAASVGRLGAAEAGAAGAGAARRGPRAFLAGSTAASLAVFAADAYLVPKAIGALSKVPGLLGAKHLNDKFAGIADEYNSGGGSFGQRRAIEAMTPEIQAALTAANHGDFSKLQSTYEAVTKALEENKAVYDAASYSTSQHTAALKVNAAAAADNLKAWKAGAADREKAIAAQAAQFDIFGDTPGAKLAGKAGAADQAASNASHAAEKARTAVERAEQRLQILRSNGKATAQQLTSAENALADAKDRAANAGVRAASAQAKANREAHLAGGLTAKDLLGRERTNLAYSKSLAKDAGKLVAAGLSPAVLEQLQATEKQFPGTIHNLVGSLTHSVVKEMNANQERTQRAQEAFLGMDEAATGRLIALANKQADALLAAWEAKLNSKKLSLLVHTTILPPKTNAPKPPSVTSLITGGLPLSGKQQTTYNFNGPIIANNPDAIAAEARRVTRLRALSGTGRNGSGFGD